MTLSARCPLPLYPAGRWSGWALITTAPKRNPSSHRSSWFSGCQKKNHSRNTSACPARLFEAGVRFCIRSAGTTNTRNLPYEAAMAVSYGLPPEEGLKAVTLYPAEILGVADQFGTVEAGRRANLVVANGDVLQASTQVLGVFIDGRPYEPTSKQTRLYDKYRKRLDEAKPGAAAPAGGTRP